MITLETIPDVAEWAINTCPTDEEGKEVCVIGPNEMKARAALTVVNLLTWLRCISFLRLAKATRIFIFMLIEVIQDLTTFVIILLFFLFGFGTSSSILLVYRGNIFERVSKGAFD